MKEDMWVQQSLSYNNELLLAKEHVYGLVKKLS